MERTLNKHLLAIAISLTLTACAQSPDDEQTRDITNVEQTSSPELEDGLSADITSAELDSNPVTSDDEAMDEFGDYDEEYDEDLAAVLEEVEQGEGEYGVPGVYDPFEGFNRAMWNLNYDYFDPYLARPVSLAYVDYTPSFIRTGIKNFLANLDEPASMVNSA